MQFHPLGRSDRWKLKFWKSQLKFGMWIDMQRSFNIDEHLTEQHWQPVFLFSKPSVSIHVCCSHIELSRSKLHKTGDLQVGNWHVNCQHSSFYILLHWRLPCGVLKRSGASNQCLPHSIATRPEWPSLQLKTRRPCRFQGSWMPLHTRTIDWHLFYVAPGRP